MKQDTQKKEKSISKKDISEKVTHREAAAVQEASKEIVPKDITHRKTLQELTLKDNFLFAAVMIDPENCRQLLELALGLEIECVEVDTEKSIVYHPEYKGVRLDVYAKDEHHTRFNVEMQVARQTIEKRVRYYHSQMDMELILAATRCFSAQKGKMQMKCLSNWSAFLSMPPRNLMKAPQTLGTSLWSGCRSR